MFRLLIASAFLLLLNATCLRVNADELTTRSFTYLNGPYYSGLMSFAQPGGPVFTGTYERDHFSEFYRTEDGYTFVLVGPEDCPSYEYADLDVSGELVGSGLLVGVDSAPSSAYMLGRCGDAAEALKTKWHNFNQSLSQRRVEHGGALDECAEGEYKIGIILVEFPDRPHVPGALTINIGGNLYDDIRWGQTTENIETMLNSEGIYRGVQPNEDPEGEGHNPNAHPNEGEYVFRSFCEYWKEASYGFWDIQCEIVNDRDGSNEAQWLMMDRWRDVNRPNFPHDLPVQESSCFWHENWQWLSPQSDNPTVSFKRDLFARIRELHPEWLDANPDPNVFEAYHSYIIFYPGGPNDDNNVCSFSVLPEGDYAVFDSDAALTFPLMIVPDQVHSFNKRPHFIHIGLLAHEFGHLAFYLPDLRGCGFTSLMAQGNNCGVNRRDNNPCRLGALIENNLGCDLSVPQHCGGFFSCLQARGRGGVTVFTGDVSILCLSAPESPIGNDYGSHYVYGLPGYNYLTNQCDQSQITYLVEARKVSIETDQFLRTGIDDHILLEDYIIPDPCDGCPAIHQGHDFDEHTSETQMVVWRMINPGAMPFEDPYIYHPGWQAIVRNEPSINERVYPASDGGTDFVFFWPGHLQDGESDPPSLSPYSFPGLGRACGAIKNIQPGPFDGCMSFEYVHDYRNSESRERPVVVDEDTYIFGTYSFRDDLIVRDDATLYLHPAYFCLGNGCGNEESQYFGEYCYLNFNNNAGLVVEQDGHIRSFPDAQSATPDQPHFGVIISGDPSWSGVRIVSDDPSNRLCALVNNFGTTPGLTVFGKLQLVQSQINSENNEVGLVVMPGGECVTNISVIRGGMVGLLITPTALARVIDTSIRDCGAVGILQFGGQLGIDGDDLLGTHQIRNNGIDPVDGLIGGVFCQRGLLKLKCATISLNRGPGVHAVDGSNLVLSPIGYQDSFGGCDISDNHFNVSQILLD